MILSDRSIKERLGLTDMQRLVIDPFDPNDLQPASYDLHLGLELREYIPPFTLNAPYTYLDPRDPYPNATRVISLQDDPFILNKGASILAVTKERIELPSDLKGRLGGKSSLDRMFLSVAHGLADPGWQGHLTLEMTNNNVWGIRLEYGMPIAQISFLLLSTPAERPYGSKELRSRYQGATSVEGAKALG